MPSRACRQAVGPRFAKGLCSRLALASVDKPEIRASARLAPSPGSCQKAILWTALALIGKRSGDALVDFLGIDSGTRCTQNRAQVFGQRFGQFGVLVREFFELSLFDLRCAALPQLTRRSASSPPTLPAIELIWRSCSSSLASFARLCCTAFQSSSLIANAFEGFGTATFDAGSSACGGVVVACSPA
jgi:hypothetical protein